jgi:recombination associated protein RdgC
MDILEKIEKTETIGKDFLLWLWFRSETQKGIFDKGDGLSAEIMIDGKMTLETDEIQDSVTCSCANPLMKEARFALMENKKITKAAIRLTINEEDEFFFRLDSRWMNFRLLKTPRVIQDLKDDPEGFFYEKTGLIERAITVLDSVFMDFIRIRVSPEWESSELPALIKWIRSGNSPLPA